MKKILHFFHFYYTDIDTWIYIEYINKRMENTEPEEPKENTDEPEKSNEFFVYLLESSCKRATYVGATVNLERRLRQRTPPAPEWPAVKHGAARVT